MANSVCQHHSDVCQHSAEASPEMETMHGGKVLLLAVSHWTAAQGCVWKPGKRWFYLEGALEFPFVRNNLALIFQDILHAQA